MSKTSLSCVMTPSLLGLSTTAWKHAISTVPGMVYKMTVQFQRNRSLMKRQNNMKLFANNGMRQKHYSSSSSETSATTAARNWQTEKHQHQQPHGTGSSSCSSSSICTSSRHLKRRSTRFHGVTHRKVHLYYKTFVYERHETAPGAPRHFYEVHGALSQKQQCDN